MAGVDKITIALDGIGHTISDNRLAVPIYQRSYAWERKNVDDFLQDIENAMGSGQDEYFMGSIVLMASERGFHVVDGQQRLATASIFLAIVRDFFYLKDEKETAFGLEQKYLFERELRTKTLLPRLTLNETDHDFFAKRILSRPDDAQRTTPATKPSHIKLAAAADAIRDKINSITNSSSKAVELVHDWIEYLHSKVSVIRVQVPDDLNAFSIFETLNDRGLELAISDLLKNNLFHIAGNRIKEAQQRWIAMIAALEAADSEDMVVTFIRHFWSSRHGLVRERELYNDIKKRVKTSAAAVDLTSSFAENARLYAAILNPNHEIWIKYGATAKGHIETLNKLRIQQIRPLILAVLDKFSIAEARKALQLFVSWSVRFLISGGLGGGTLETYYSESAKKIRDGAVTTAKQLSKEMISVVPTDSEFKSAFEVASVSKSYLARYYLLELEKTLRASKGELVPNANEELVNLEHILPQTPGKEWAHIDAETAATFYNRIGNLTLMLADANVVVGNAAFADKLKAYKDSDLQITSGLTKHKHWTRKEIEERQRILADLALQTWKI